VGFPRSDAALFGEKHVIVAVYRGRWYGSDDDDVDRKGLEVMLPVC
jgi:hypothetical protein